MFTSIWLLRMRRVALLAMLAAVGIAQASEVADEPEARRSVMNGERLGELVRLLDEDAERQGNSWQFRVGGRVLVLVFDEASDRMRMMAPIAESDVLSPGLMLRMLQANFDAVLDVRYAVANEIVWSAYTHPLGSLSDEQVASAIAQVVIAADTFGTTFVSGAMTFGGGDSREHHERLEEELRRRLERHI